MAVFVQDLETVSGGGEQPEPAGPRSSDARTHGAEETVPLFHGESSLVSREVGKASVKSNHN